MAIIRPLRAWRYHTALAQEVEQLISPPFDVISEKQRRALYQYPYNSIHLSAPAGESPAEQAGRTLQEWKKEGILMQDPSPGIYVYYQYFQLPGSDKAFCRKGFICFIEASSWEKKVVLRHEDTIPGSVNDRISLLKATQLNASPTHGLYTDEQHLLEKLMDQSMENPLHQAEDYQGVRNVLSVIEDPQVIQYFVETLRARKIILADGHHRYESSLVYRQEQIKYNPQHTGEEGYNFHLMYLTNAASDDLSILPTHRLLHHLPAMEKHEVLAKAARHFHIMPVENACDIPEVILGKRWTFGLLLGEDCYKIQLKEEVFPDLNWKADEAVKQLDVVVLHHFFIEKVLGIPQEAQSKSSELSYERNFAQCLYQIATHKAQLALIVNGISIEKVKEICHKGQLMPQKSTYFYPKAICGFLFGSIKEDEV